MNYLKLISCFQLKKRENPALGNGVTLNSEIFEYFHGFLNNLT